METIKVLVDKNGFLFKFIEGNELIKKAIQEKKLSFLHIGKVNIDIPEFKHNKKTKTGLQIKFKKSNADING